MTVEELKKLIKAGENGVVEFKRGRGGVPGDFWPSYSAFANTDGGVIVLGVKEENGVRVVEGGERSGMGLSKLYSTWAELGYDPPELEESHEPDQTVLKVYLKTSRKSAKTREKKTRGKSSADAVEPLKNKGETPKTVGKKTVGKSAKTVGKDEETREKKTRGKSANTREKKFDFPPEELVVLRLTAQRLISVMKRNPRVTTAELAAELGVTDKGIEWQIVKLRKDKMIRRVGGRKFGSWEVLI